jgi:MFS family permease
MGALVQGGAVGRLVKKMGEPRLIATSLFLAAIGIGILPYLNSWTLLLIGLAIFSIGSSLTRPPVFGMISMLAPANEQGATMGVAQGVGSLARIVGPLFAATLFEIIPPLPYVFCAVVCFITSVIAMQFLTHVVPATPAGATVAITD